MSPFSQCIKLRKMLVSFFFVGFAFFAAAAPPRGKEKIQPAASQPPASPGSAESIDLDLRLGLASRTDLHRGSTSGRHQHEVTEQTNTQLRPSSHRQPYPRSDPHVHQGDEARQTNGYLSSHSRQAPQPQFPQQFDHQFNPYSNFDPYHHFDPNSHLTTHGHQFGVVNPPAPGHYDDLPSHLHNYQRLRQLHQLYDKPQYATHAQANSNLPISQHVRPQNEPLFSYGHQFEQGPHSWQYGTHSSESIRQYHQSLQAQEGIAGMMRAEDDIERHGSGRWGNVA